MDGSRTLRTRPQVGLRSQRTDKSRQVQLRADHALTQTTQLADQPVFDWHQPAHFVCRASEARQKLPELASRLCNPCFDFTNSLELRIACNASALQNSSVPRRIRIRRGRK